MSDYESEVEQAPENIAKIMRDNALREDTVAGDGFTGPKGVLSDYKFHQQQERERANAERQALQEKLSNTGLSSGWLQRQIEQENAERFGEEDEVDELFRELEQESSEYQILQMKRLVNLKRNDRFGNFQEINGLDLATAVEQVGPDTKVLVHVYRHSIPECREINRLLVTVAKRSPLTKFIRVNADDIQIEFDNVVFPVFLVYQQGELADTLMRVHHELRGWSINGTCEPEDLEDYFIKKAILSENSIEYH